MVKLRFALYILCNNNRHNWNNNKHNEMTLVNIKRQTFTSSDRTLFVSRGKLLDGAALDRTALAQHCGSLLQTLNRNA